MKRDDLLEDLLRRTRRQLKLMELATGAVVFVTALLAFLTVAVILDHTVALPTVGRWAALATLSGAVAVVMVLAATFLIRRLSDVYIARLIEEHYPTFRNTLISSIETRGIAEIPQGIKEFIQDQASEKAVSVDPDVVISHRQLVLGAYALLFAILFFFTYTVLSPKSIVVSIRRILEPGADIPPPTATVISSVEPGSKAVLVGNSVPVKVDVRGVLPRRASLHWSYQQELWETVELRTENDGRTWETLFPDLQEDLYYRIFAGDAVSPVYHLHVVPTPLVNQLETIYQPPAYSRLPAKVEKRGDVDALAGTVITVRAHTNTTLAKAHLMVNDGRVPAVVHHPQAGEEPGDTIEASFQVTRPGSYYSIHLEDPYGFTNPDPPRYEILCRWDQPPAVHIIEPVGTTRQPLEDPLEVHFEAKDDLGLARLELHYRLSGDAEDRVEELPLPANLREIDTTLTIHLDAMGLEPGQIFAGRLEATDTFPDKPHLGRSANLVVLASTAEEIAQIQARLEAEQEEEKTPPPPAPPPVAAAPEEAGQEVQGEIELAEARFGELTIEQMIRRDRDIINTIQRFLRQEVLPRGPELPGEVGARPEGEPGVGAALLRDDDATRAAVVARDDGEPGDVAVLGPGDGGEESTAVAEAPGVGPTARIEGTGGRQAEGEAGNGSGEQAGNHTEGEGDNGPGEQAGGQQGQGQEQGAERGQGRDQGRGEGDGDGGRGEGRQNADAGQEPQGQGEASDGQAAAEGQSGRGAGGQGRSAHQDGTPSMPGELTPGIGDSPGEGGGGGGGVLDHQAPDLKTGSQDTPDDQIGPRDIDVVGNIVEDLYSRLVRNDIDPDMLTELDWSVQELATWVVTYKGKLDALAGDQVDEGFLLTDEAPEQMQVLRERVIEMGSAGPPLKPVVAEGTTALSPDEVKELLERARGTVSPEYRQLLEDYYRGLAETAP